MGKSVSEKRRENLEKRYKICVSSSGEVKKPRGRPPKRIIIEKEIEKSTMDYIKRVENLNLNGNIAENWRTFKQNYDIFYIASEIEKKSEEVQIAVFLNTIGPEAVEVYNSFNLSDADKKKYTKVIEAFENFCKPKKNEVYETYIFQSRNQAPNEPFDNFYMDIKKLVKSCEFNDQVNRMLRDRIVMGVYDQALQKKLLETEQLDLTKAVEIARAWEATKDRMEKMHPSSVHSMTSMTCKSAERGKKTPSTNSNQHFERRENATKSQFRVGNQNKSSTRGRHSSNIGQNLQKSYNSNYIGSIT